MNDKRHLRAGAAVLLFILAAACTCTHEREAPVAQSVAVPVALGTLELRDHTVTIWVGEGESSLYTVADKEGAILADRVDQAGLKDRFPALHDALEGSVAGEAVIWADVWAED